MLDRQSIETKTFPRNPTDHLSFDPPANERPFQRLFDHMVTKPKYNINVRSNFPWEPHKKEGNKCINNRSSVQFDIINHKGGLAPALVMGLLDNKVTNKKKGIGEFGDLQRPTAININADHSKAYSTDPHVFKRKDGIFAHLYDAAHRFGDDKPFKA